MSLHLATQVILPNCLAFNQDTSKKNTLKNQMETQRAETAEFTERDYNQEFREALLKHPGIEKPPLFDLLSIAEKLIGLKVWLVEDAIWEAIKDLGAQVSDEEKEYFFPPPNS
jgi:hypothetical protein